MKRQTWSILIAASGLLFLIFDSKTALNGANAGIELCVKALIPSLFPFFVLSALLTGSFRGIRGKWMGRVEKVTGIPEGSGHLLLLGFLSGFPVGAKNVWDSCRDSTLSIQAQTKLAALCNNAGPSFLFGILATQFQRSSTVWLLWCVQIISVLFTARLANLRQEGRICTEETMPVTPVQAIHQAIRSMGSVCGWVVLIRVVLAFFEKWFFPILPEPGNVILSGLLELSNGCMQLSVIPREGLQFLIAAVMLSFGGICIYLQTESVCSGISGKTYFRIKLTESIVSIILSLIVQGVFSPNARISLPRYLLPGLIFSVFALLILKKAVAFRPGLMYNQENKAERG